MATRLWRLDLAHFQDDQATLLSLTADFLDGRRFPFFGMVFSTGVHHPPLEIFLLALPLLLSRNPLVATGFVALLDAAGVLVCYVIGRRFLGARAGLVAAGLYAVNPVALIYARRVWNPSFVPVLSAVALLSLLLLVVERRPAWAAPALAAFGAMAQLHLATIAYLPLLLLAFALAWRQLRWRWVALGLGLVLLSLAPYLWYQATHGWEDLRAFLAFMGRPAPWDPPAALQPVTLVGQPLYLTEIAAPGPATPLDAALRLAGWAEVALFAVGAVTLLATAATPLCSRAPAPPPTRPLVRSSVRSSAPLLVLAWALPPLAFALRHQVPLAPHYFLGLYPAPFLAIGAAAAPGCTPWWRRAAGRLALGAAAVVALAQLVALPPFLGRVERFGASGGYDPPLGQSLAAAQVVRRAAAPDEEVYVGSRDEMAGVLTYLLRDSHPTRHFDAAHTLLLPAPGRPSTTYLIEDDGGPADRLLRDQAAGQRVGQVHAGDGQSVYSVYRLPAAFAEEARRALAPRAMPAVFGGAARVMGFALEGGGERPWRVEARLLWEVAADPSPLPGETAQFGHLLDAQGRGWGGQDYRGYPRYLWRPGDRVLSWFQATPAEGAPPGAYWLATGFYARYTQARLPVVDANGHSLGTEARLGPIKLTDNAGQPPPGPPLATFGHAITLDRAELPAAVTRGQPLSVTLRWRATGHVGADYTVFLHVLDAASTLVAQADGPPDGGRSPTSLWDSGDLVPERRSVETAALPPGAYQVRLGLYTPADLRRLPVADAQGRPSGDSFLVGSVQVQGETR